MTKIVLMTGRAQSGKSTAADVLKAKSKQFNKSVEIYSFADPLKKFCHNVLGLTWEQCWGSNEDKNTFTKIKWEDVPISWDIKLEMIYPDVFENQKKYGLSPHPSYTHCCEVMTTQYYKDINIDNTKQYLTARQVMQVFGTNICRKMYPDCWAEATKKKIIEDNFDVALIADVRFPNELEVFSNMDPVVVRLTRNVTKQNHISETALDDYDFTKFKRFYKIDNSSMSLEEKSLILMKLLANELR